MSENVDDFLRASDAFSWYMERDPGLRSTIVALAWLDRSPDWDYLVDKLDRATRAVPLFRMRLVEPVGRLTRPRWVVADDFDVAWHLQRVNAPEPRTADTAIDMAAAAATRAFDPAHPLWEFTVIEHMVDDRAALLMKVHHSLTDGIGGMKLALNLFDLSPEPSSLASEDEVPVGQSLSFGELLRRSVLDGFARIPSLVAHDVVAVSSAAVSASLHPVCAASRTVSTARSIGRMVAPVTRTLSPVMTDRSLGRTLGMLTLSVDDLKRGAAAAAGTVNDGFIAGLTAGMRRYHESYGATVDELRVTMPISVRTANDPVAGNRITLQRFTVPVGLSDTVARIKEIGRRCRAARDEPALPHTNAIAAVLNLLPSPIVGGMLKHVDLLASNVPGFTFPVYLAGAEVTRYFPFGPTIGAAINATLLSYNGTCCVGVTMDTAAVPDPDRLMTCLAQGLDEVLRLGGDHRPVDLPLRDAHDSRGWSEALDASPSSQPA